MQRQSRQFGFKFVAHSRRLRYTRTAALFVLWLATDLCASFHFMQIEQVIAGVNGDYSAQAIQLRMRSAGQEQVQLTRLVAWDANGENPVVLIDFEDFVSVSQTGARILAATETFARYMEPQAVPDFILTELLPPSYVTAGSLTFETDEGDFIVWRLSWGGEDYRGSTSGGQTNDDNGDFGPPVAAPLPGDGLTALRIVLGAESTGTGSAADFMLGESPALFFNNTGTTVVLSAFTCPDDTAGADTDGDGVGAACDFCPDDPVKIHAGRCGCGVTDDDSDGDGLADCAALPAPVSDDGSDDSDDSEDDTETDADSPDGEGEGHTDDGHSDDGSHDDATSPDDPDEPAPGTIGEVHYGAFCGPVAAWMWGLVILIMFATAQQRRYARERHRICR